MKNSTSSSPAHRLHSESLTSSHSSGAKWAGTSCILPGALLIAITTAALAVGKFDVPVAALAHSLLAKVTGAESGLDHTVETVIWQVRIPRVMAGLMIGAALAGAGTIYQGLFRNPLVSPDILGVSAGSSLGAICGIFFSQSVFVIQVLAFAGGLLAVWLVYAIALFGRNRDPVLTLVLCGIGVGALLGASISLLKVLADPYNQLPAITFWLLGSLAAVTSSDAMSILPAILLGLLPAILLRWRMNAMTLPDEEARALGVDTRRLRWVLVACATLMTAAAVSISGVVGWIGLLVPHVARLLVGPSFPRLFPLSVIMGAGFLIAVDTLARVAGQIEVPLGILTAMLGAPFFLYLIMHSRGGWQ